MSGDAGIYGMALNGLPGARHLLRPARPSWPTLTVSTSVEPGAFTTPIAEYEDDHSAHYRQFSGGGHVRLDRRAMTAHFVMNDFHDDQDFVHPFLAMASSILTWWMGRDGFHAGAFLHGAGAWVVLGVREAGKSSLLAQLHLDGVPILSDDLVVIDQGEVLPGPGCIDLRTGAAEHFGVGQDIGVVGARRRHRLVVAPDAAPVPLAGWVLPRWGDACTVTRVSALATLPALVDNQALERAPRDPARLLDLASRPFLEWRRPRDWSSMRTSVDALIAATA